MNKKFVVILLALFMLIPLFCACNGDGDVESVATSEGDGKTPFGLEPKNWGGKDIVFSIGGVDADTYTNCEIAAYETNGSAVNDASYERYILLAEQYGINVVTQHREPSDVDIIKNSIEADTCEFDVIVNSSLNLAKYALEGLLYDLADIESLNLSNPWWEQASIRDLSVKNHIFFVTGDLLVSDQGATWGVFVNKDLYNNLFNTDGSKPIYDYVYNNEWTIDQMYELSKVASQGSTADYENDTFGIIAQTYDGIACMMSYDQKMIDKDIDDCFIINVQNEETYTKFDKMFEVLTDTENTCVAEMAFNSEYYLQANTIFAEGRALFQYNKVAYVQTLLDSNADFTYGILPMPKFDSTQNNYCSPATVYWAQFIALPSTTRAEDLEFISYALEALGYYGQEILQPKYYEETIKLQKFTSDDDDKMLDTIFENRIWDPAAVYDFGSSLYIYTGLIMSENNAIASSIESHVNSIQSSIDTIMEQVDILEGTQE